MTEIIIKKLDNVTILQNVFIYCINKSIFCIQLNIICVLMYTHILSFTNIIHHSGTKECLLLLSFSAGKWNFFDYNYAIQC
jgi:hypothetical protein